MIQRIQSIFLFLAAGCALALYGLPFATTPTVVANSDFFADKVFNIYDNVGLMVLFTAAGLLSLIALFMFKDRTRQKLLVRLAIIADIIAIVLGVVLSMRDLSNVQMDLFNEKAGVFLPALFLAFAIAALVYIGKDDKLVRSADRLR